MKRLCILGSTGSIGTQTLQVVRHFPEEFKIESLTCGFNIELLLEQIQEFHPSCVSVATKERKETLKRMLPRDSKVKVFCGEDGHSHCATLPKVDCVVAAMVGMKGLAPVVAAIHAGKEIELANKETLVAGGSIVMPLVKQKNVSLRPVDSEHSAIWQCLMGQPKGSLKKILLTASGGPFRGYSREQLEQVTLDAALNHPTWNMGGKITIDSATMMNKGLEVIEASWLFDCPVDRIDIVVHPQSIVHSMVELNDGSVLAQMGFPNMMMPIQVALFYPERSLGICRPFSPFDEQSGTLTFEPCDRSVFRLVDMAYHAALVGGTLPAAMNAANEVIVADFLAGKASFLDIERTVAKVMERHERDGVTQNPSLAEIFAVDEWARMITEEIRK
ncbi:MAG: 1-deoxy-D-xylulose-5-phosphate reductoisomerase [Clostridiales bacterium]|nr:1-deoxy-D-xylulose-5-phosphate reductoisomerase [Clostridiales bacterium]MBR5040375.1 1-deoxy-D-xylulose-5-phosphate reductoisomerase [Clostridiales bacterium]MBR5057914.1 1-deoxy-D-xylulose-5-phosphate reductoisomerase [Clostridiales bacterium]